MCVTAAILVGYEMTTYTTTEGMGYVELCAVITNPSVGVVSPRPFVISATTVDDTAGRELQHQSYSLTIITIGFIPFPTQLPLVIMMKLSALS